MEQEISKKLKTGLTTAQIQERIAAGQVNGEQEVRTKSYGQILRDNLFTLFNLINVILLVCILISGSIRNALFFLVVIWNFLIGSIQEIRAKKTIDQLSLLSEPKVYALRDGQIREILIRDIVLGEIMQLKTGCQICADALVLEGTCQVNESLITGESTPILKKAGDHLFSGSFLISGHVMAEAEHVGAENYVNQITLGAKYFKKPDSVIMRSVKAIVRIIAIAVIPLAGLLVWNNFFRNSVGFSADMVRTVASISAMIPGGLILLVSIVLAVSVVRLSVHHTLVQDLYCVENLARVDMLLLDKTGTITEGILKVEKVEPLDTARWSPETLRELLGFYMDVSDDENATASAIREYLLQASSDTEVSPTDRSSARFIPFSSERKWSMVLSGTEAYVLGAPEFLIPESEDPIREKIRAYSEIGKRVVVLAVSSDASRAVQNEDGEYQLPKNLSPACFIIIGDQVRKEAPATFDYFEAEQVTIKVLTGDSPVTASYIAGKAGLQGAQQWVDASRITSKDELKELAEVKTVFGRVTPVQKCQIVQALQEKGHTVAMIGDGANDVLALKEADCSVAMQSGSDAARNVANMVLLDSNFASLPLVVAEGRKSINNLQRSASLYLTKTTYALILSIFFLFTTTLLYPFENIQVTLIGAITIGIPSFFLALEPNHERIRKNFLWNVLKFSVPSGILEAVALIFLLFWLNRQGDVQREVFSSASVYLMLIMGILVILNLSGRLRLWKLLLIIGLCGVALGAVLLFPGVFSLVAVSGEVWKVIGMVAGGFFVIHLVICRVVLPRVEK